MQLLKLNSSNRLEKTTAHSEATHVHLTIEEYNELIDLKKSVENLKRIVREKSNSEKNLNPKKKRSGYTLLNFDTYNLKFNFENSNSFQVRRLLLETPYSIASSYFETEKLVAEDLIQTISELLNADGVVPIDNITDANTANEIIKSNENLLIMAHLEMQRNGYWAVRIYSNYTPDINSDLIRSNETHTKNP